MELFSPALRTLWNNYELPVLVLVSLILQIILIILGNRRKVSSSIGLSILLWLSYLMADSVATVSLGILSRNFSDVINYNGVPMAPDMQLNAFWAPFLLLHLGGPDTITAYSLEDNELWLRHLLGLGVQTGVTLYIFFVTWMGSQLSILAIPMIMAGLIKYGERTWVLRIASNEHFRESMLTDPDPGPNYHKFMDEYTLRQLEGYFVQAEELYDVELPEDVSPVRNSSIPDASELIKADELFKTFKCLFVDLILSFQDRDYSQSLFKDMRCEEAFKIVEIELGFMFDVLYTKAPIVYSVQGCILRFITLSLTSVVLVLFSLFEADKPKFSKVDLILTFLLLVVAILLELFAVVSALSSDWTDLYLSKHPKSALRRVITSLQWVKQSARWSNSLAQYNLLSFCLNTRPVVCSGVLKLCGIHKKLEEYLCKANHHVSRELKELIFDHLKKQLNVTKEAIVNNEKHKELKDEPRGDKRLKDESSNGKELQDEQSGDNELKGESSKGIGLNKGFTNNDNEPKEEAKRKLKQSSDGEKELIEQLSKDKEQNKKPASKKLNKTSSRDGVRSGVNLVLKQFGHPSLKWSTDEEFDRSILIWHIATDICYYEDLKESSHPDWQKEYEMTKQLSDYLLYLLIMHPSMLPMGIGNIRYRDTCAEAREFFEERYSIIGSGQSDINISQKILDCIMGCVGKKRNLFEKEYACKMLLKVNTVVPPSKVKGDRSKSVLFDGCRLASELQDISDKSEKWKMVSKVWVEMLAFAASQCKATYHARQLGRGGELLTHVWLLMAHLGLTEQFQISKGHARAMLVAQ